MALVRFNYTNFSVTPNGLLTINVPGYVYVMFYMTNCKACHRYMPLYKSFPSKINGCTFGIANATSDQQAIQRIVSQSNVAFDTVPTFVLFCEGIAFAVYPFDQKDLRSVAHWITQQIAAFNNNNNQQVSVPVHYQQPPQQQPRHQPRQQQLPHRNPRRQPRENQPIYSDETGVRIFKTSYGIPFNATNADEYTKMEEAYLNSI